MLFTTSPRFIAYARRFGIDTITRFPSNRYHLPVVTAMLQIISERYSASYYGYQNSDILLNPHFMRELEIVDKAIQSGQIRKPVEVSAHVFNMPVDNLAQQLKDPSKFDSIIRRYKRRIVSRTTTCAVGPLDSSHA